MSEKIEKIYKEIIEKHLPNDQICYLTVVVMLDKPLRDGTTIVEKNPIVIDNRDTAGKEGPNV